MSVKEKYLKNSDKCPICNSSDISAGTIEAEIGCAWQSAECSGCGAERNDVYALVDIENLKGGGIR